MIRQGPHYIILMLAGVMLVSVQCLGRWKGLLGQLSCTCLPYCYLFRKEMEHVVLAFSWEWIGLSSGALWNGYVVLVLDSHCSGSGAKSISFLHFLVQHCSISNILYNKTFACSVISLYAKVIHAPQNSFEENHSRISLMHSPSYNMINLQNLLYRCNGVGCHDG